MKMKDVVAPRNEWPMGLVVEAIKSEDDKVRKAKVEVMREGKKKTFLRPVSELILLLAKDSD